MKNRCIIHTWFYVASSDGTRNPFTDRLITRQDRFCIDCDKMQTRVNQFTEAHQKELRFLTKTYSTADWITFEENDSIDKLTRHWLKSY